MFRLGIFTAVAVGVFSLIPVEASASDVVSLLDEDGASVLVTFPDGSVKTGNLTGSERRLVGEGYRVESDSRVKVYDWGVDRINQPLLPLDGVVSHSGGNGVRVYVVDTGVDYSLASNFAPRGFDAVDGDGWADGSWQIKDGDPRDCHGHGTHVAGVVGSGLCGVSEGATIVGVRVLNCGGSGYTSDVVNGINWAVDDAAGRPAVINMSLGGSYSQALNDAVANAVSSGVTVVVAAGNDNTDVRYYSPASAPSAITVAASDKNDNKAVFSNYGYGVDVFAPGTNIESLRMYGGSVVMSGTSMAAPHVAGVAAGYLSENPTATPAEVSSYITSSSSPVIIRSDNSTTRNLVQWNVGEASPKPTPTPAPEPTPSPEPNPSEPQRPTPVPTQPVDSIPVPDITILPVFTDPTLPTWDGKPTPLVYTPLWDLSYLFNR